MARDPAYQRFDVIPLTGALGAEIRGADLANDRDPALVAEVRRALDQYLVLAIRGQKFDVQRYHEAARRFGPFSGNPVHVPLDGYDDIVKFVREPSDTDNVIGDHWHMDLAWMDPPPGIVMLYGESVPPYGGDTCFTSLVQAYKALSPGMKEMLQRLTGIHSARGVYSINAKSKRLGLSIDQEKLDAVEKEHPVICLQPNTGRRYLLVNSVLTRFKGMTEAESKPIVDYLFHHALRSEFQCRVRWEDGTLTMWNNPLVMHSAIDDYRGFRRVTYRTTVEGWAQIAAPPETNHSVTGQAA
ncbi:MAG: TauD/TfdA family dioxygenase [Alphaproteobacteria bacterium]|nr:TauD/TfdA family dioxygenase [Alphaproteobacteria bacterium]